MQLAGVCHFCIITNITTVMIMIITCPIMSIHLSILQLFFFPVRYFKRPGPHAHTRGRALGRTFRRRTVTSQNLWSFL